MQTIAIINCGRLALATILVTMVTPALGQGTVIIQHTGNTDPLTEGFVGGAYGSAPITNDLGFNAWATPSSTNAFSNYGYTLSPQQQLGSIGADWSFTVNVRVATANVTNTPFYAGLDVGSEGHYRLYFGSAPNGDPYVAYPLLNYGDISNVINLPGAGSTYNNYQLIYDASADTASLWINGVEYANNISPLEPDYGFGAVDWGCGGSSTYAQANWNSISLEIVPEPSTWSVIMLGSGVLIYVRRKWKRK
jgi:hypothetical protein